MIEALVKTQVVSMYILTLSLPCLPRRHSENDQQKCQMWNQYGLFSPSHEQVKGFKKKNQNAQYWTEVDLL